MSCGPDRSAVAGLNHTDTGDILFQSSYHGVCIHLNKSLSYMAISQKDH